MADGGEAVSVRVIERIAEVPADDWNRCAGDANPFISHAFLHALEASGSATGETGWLAQHVVAEDRGGHVRAVVPMYLKSHSYGEYVFDHGWADAFARAGGRYYPKLQIAVPFTPVPGPRLLIAPDADIAATRGALIGALAEVARRHRVSSVHCTFCTAEEADAFAAAGWLVRHGLQYHWDNRGYATFDDFLGALSHGRRKAIRRERRDVAAAGLEIETLSGDALRPEHWAAFYDFYIATSERKWGDPYLTPQFFQLLGKTMADQVALVLVRKDGRYIAGALNLQGRDTLYGRNWGCRGDYPFLHFEACYYQAIDHAIRHGLARVEAGAQGEHKIQRGYLPQRTYSAHWIAHQGFRDAVADFLRRERPQVARQIKALGEYSPYKHVAPALEKPRSDD
jgi:predicted N-acyltransferase